MSIKLIRRFVSTLIIIISIDARPTPDPSVEANHIRKDIFINKDIKASILPEEKLKSLELSLDDSLIFLQNLKEKKVTKQFKSSSVKYRSKKIIKKEQFFTKITSISSLLDHLSLPFPMTQKIITQRF